MTVLLIYLVLISCAGAAVTVYDKVVSKKKGHRRVPERTLLLLGFLGGSFLMYAVMLVIRHKTRHKKFMLGLPAIMLLQAASAWAIHIIAVWSFA